MMEKMDLLTAIKYITLHNPVCSDCARGDLKQVRKAAGLYQLVKEISTGDELSFEVSELDIRIEKAVSF